MDREVFIYYRVDAADESRVRAQVRQFQARLASRCPGLEAGLYVRLDPGAGGLRTLMEVYRRPGGVDDDCEAAIAAAAAAALDADLRSPRQVEWFGRCGG